MKICYIASSGGHLSELKNIIFSCRNSDFFIVTESKTNKRSVDKNKVNYYLREINRKELFFVFHFIALLFRELFIFLKEKPDIVISTGALVSYPMLKYAKVFNKKTIYIESFARVYDLSLTGKKLYNKVDLFIVQREELSKKYNKAVYVGNLFGDIK